MVGAVLASPFPVAFFPGSLKGIPRGRAGSRGLLAPILASAPSGGMCKFASPWNSLCACGVFLEETCLHLGEALRAGLAPAGGLPHQNQDRAAPQIWLPLCGQENRADLRAFGPWLLAAVLTCERGERTDVFRVC